ncbi:MAG: trehalose-phosphatase [Rhodoferax sp.]|uniref:trehalose-phosphatase n=1 Tax=Rhodoferax sp. TaxID=50421 RepID=UPI0014007A13|nr:trehalose-phosphatase [Rhodoferax sp.]NDP39621.1 trehalose-phosphatase [Rhodoferax sp.]
MNAKNSGNDSQCLTLGRAAFDAIIFDLDGVVTRTAKVHATAWKTLFDAFLQQQAGATGKPLQPFDMDVDYRRLVDGKPRYDGVADFLKSRGIHLPYGDPADPPERETVCGLGNRKNLLYLQALKQGVEVYDSTIGLIHQLRAQGFKTAIISASNNCAQVLESAGITALFDVRVDGVAAQRLGLAGKPAPDVFLEAARQLGVKPARSVVVEDALAGVQAGRRGGFGMVIGVDRNGHRQEKKDAGAHVVVADLAEVGIARDTASARRRSAELPSALAALDDIKTRMKGRNLAVFLDYDGTLTPIVQRPELALLSDDMREAVRALAQGCTVVVMSGRDLPDVQARVGLKDIVYGGSHGFEIRGPQGMHIEQQQGSEFLPQLDLVELGLRQRLGRIPGILVERKKYSIAVHFRLVGESDLDAVEPAVNAVLATHPTLRKTHGKKIFEVQPDIDWDKGRAMIWLLGKLGLEQSDAFVLYLGDDITDEDAFRSLNARGNGIGILVRDGPRDTTAQYALDSVEQVRRFLSELATLKDGKMA